MLVSGDLGFSGLVLVVSFAFPVIVLIIRRKWRLAQARKEEIKRLLILASEEAARAELEASYGSTYSAVSVTQYHQCAVCFFPTTTRCSKCKAVRYCSGKCQIIHWRQGHKDECRPPTLTQVIKDESNNSTNEKEHEEEQSEVNDDLFLEVRQSAKPTEISSEESATSDASSSPEVRHRKDDKVKVEFHADGEGSSSTYESSDRSFSGFTTSHTSSESSDDVSVCESTSSVESEKLDGPLSAGPPLDMPETSNVKNLDQTMPLSPKFASLVNSVNNFSKLNNLNRIKPDADKPGSGGESQCTSTSSSDLKVRCRYEGLNLENCKPSSSFWGRTLESAMDVCDDSSLSNSPSPLKFSPSRSLFRKDFEVKGIIPDDAFPAASGRPTDGVALSKNSNADGTKIRNSPSLNCKSSRHTENETNIGGSHVSRSEGLKTSVSVPSCVSSNTRGLSSEKRSHVIKDNIDTSHCVGMHSVPSLRSVRIGDPESNSAMLSRDENCSSNDRNGLKGSKLSKQYSVGVGSETAGRYSDKVLFSYELFVKLYNWNKVELQPCGLINCGNSCYANVVLQCLVFTPPLTAYFLQGLHSKECAKKGWCFTCELENLILKAKERKAPLSPIGILSQLQNIGSQLGNGREEDAHEFLRYAIDTMQSVCLKEARVKASGPLEEETTLIGLTFGGYLRSKIKCMKCHGKSERQERMMDLTVEIEGDIGSLEEALRRFSATEILDGENKYQCGRCKSYEKAKKKLTILEAPNILTIALKRFQSGKFGKLNKPIQFPEILDLAPYMSGTSDKSPIYRLYGVVVHLDIMNAAFSGHYVCYIKSIQNKWFKIDDSTVTAVEREKVLTKGAYMLLYARCSPRSPRLIRNRISHDLRSKVIPSWVTGKSTTSKLRSPSTSPSVVQFCPSSVPTDNRASIESFYSRFNQLQRILEEDSSSDSSSLISSNSDEGSCSTDSTRDSSSTDDNSDIMFGDSGCGWNSPWRNF